MRDSERNLGHSDDKAAGANEAGEERITAGDSADAKAHGAHGRGRDSQRRTDEPRVEPDEATGSDGGGSAGWGSEASGGSVIDKRPEK